MRPLIYVSNLWRQAELAEFEGSGQDQIMKLTFVYGFPKIISMALQQLPNVKMLEISKLISTRELTTKRVQEVTAAAKPGISEEPRQVDGGPSMGKLFGGKCFNYRSSHLIRYCKEPIRMMCYRCGEPENFVRDCL